MNNFRQLLESLYQQRDEHLPSVLATVVQVRGSSYRRPGARMLLTQLNERCGMISGGCLERDLALRGWELTESGPRVVAYDTRGRLEQPAGEYGAGCDGVVHVLLERLESDANWLIRILESIVIDRSPLKMATIYRCANTMADEDVCVGLRAFCSPSLMDSLSSSQVHCRTTRTIQSHLDRNVWPGETFSLHLQNRSLTSVDVLMEQLQPPLRVVVFGAGDDAIPLVKAAQVLGWDTLVCDSRASLLDPSRFPASRTPRFPSACQTVCCHPREFFRKNQFQLSAADAVVVMTHDLAHDTMLLSELVRHPVSYIGLLGPKRRTAKVIAELYRQGRLLDADELLKIRTPVGLDIGAEGPEEIALSILGEIIATRNARSGGSLNKRDGTNYPDMPHENASLEMRISFTKVLS